MGERSNVQLARKGSEPLFRQIEAGLTYEIVTGKRANGSRLPSLRDAAAEWGVNLHTVRRAYRELDTKGLVHTGAGGTRVAPLGPDPAAYGSGLHARVRRFATEAREQLGVSPATLARAFESLAQADPEERRSCSVIECSGTLSRELARDLEDRFLLETEALDLLEDPTLPAGMVVGTYFHVDQLNKLMAGRTSDLYLVRIRPRLTLMAGLARAAGAGEIRHVVLLDRLPGSAHDLAEEFQSYFGPDVTIEPRILPDAQAGFPVPTAGTIVVATPQTWDRMPADLRGRRDVRQLEYEIDPHDVERLSESLEWQPRGSRGRP
jgi:DNA-binding transcriptional regulator YhcF (GntR family)